MIRSIKSGFIGFVRLFYPKVCAGCGGNLIEGESYICLNCHESLVPTNYGIVRDNPLFKSMSARLPIQEASTMYYFTKGGIIQNILHEIKYKGNRGLATYMGELFGKKILEDGSFSNIDLIIPVPLHLKKKKNRGYNQCDLIANGIGQVTKKASSQNVLKRVVFTKTQTHKTRTERWKNVKDSFKLDRGVDLSGKHILLFDDVMTTGATLEACARTLMKIEGVTISLATLVYTDEL